jgi:hypothetical protein
MTTTTTPPPMTEFSNPTSLDLFAQPRSRAQKAHRGLGVAASHAAYASASRASAAGSRAEVRKEFERIVQRRLGLAAATTTSPSPRRFPMARRAPALTTCS